MYANHRKRPVEPVRVALVFFDDDGGTEKPSTEIDGAVQLPRRAILSNPAISLKSQA